MSQIFTKQTSRLWGLLGLLSFCAFYFLGDSIADLLGWEQSGKFKENDQFEAIIVAALVLCVALTALEIKKVLDRQQKIENQLRVASGAFADVLEEYFDQWALTQSEREVALLAIKGFSTADIARIRETKQGTIKAQSNAIYRKADVTGRPQLLSLFIEDLMAEKLVEEQAE